MVQGKTEQGGTSESQPQQEPNQGNGSENTENSPTSTQEKNETLEPTQCRFGRASSRWFSESYYVKDDQVQKILTHFGVTPQVDAFARKEDKRFARWWGPDSKEGTDAFRKRWQGKLLWLNPPYSRIPEVVRKIAKEGTHAILVIPEWKRRKYWKMTEKMAVDRMKIPAKTKLFGRVHRKCR